MSEIFGAVSGIFVLSVLKIGNPIVSANGERSVVFAGQTLFLLNMGALLTSITTYLPMFVQPHLLFSIRLQFEYMWLCAHVSG